MFARARQIPGRGILRFAATKDVAMRQTIVERTYSVPGISCEHCRAAIIEELENVPGVHAVDVDLDVKRVSVRGAEPDDVAVRAAIAEAGYDVA